MKFLTKNNYKVRYTDDYIIATGTIPVCLVAHLDTVFDYEKFRFKYGLEWFHDQERHILWSPDGAGFDDRAGVYAICELINQGFRPHVLFTFGEEIGGVGAYKAIENNKKLPFDCKFLIELDRAGYDDSVYYLCGNDKFTEYINSFGFTTQIGSFSDIYILGPAWKIASVNLSIGYLDEHFKIERLYYDVTDKTIEKVGNILSDVKNNGNKVPKFKHIPQADPFFTHQGEKVVDIHNLI